MGVITLGFRAKLVIAVVGLIAYLASTNTALTGIFIHEWLCVALAVLFALHTALHWDWTKKMFKHFVRKLLSMSRLNLVIDVLLFAMFFAVMLSGVMESRVVLPTLGLAAPAGMTWRILHSLTAKLLLVVVGVHFGLHWRWIVHATRQWFAPKPVHTPQAASTEVAS
jgi:hypothetical protein